LKRLWLAAALALALHGFLFTLGLDHPAKRKPLALPKIQTITLTFPQREQAPLNPFPSSQGTPPPAKPSVAAELSNDTPGKKPVQNKSRVAHDRHERRPVSSSGPSKPMTPESGAVTAVSGTQETVSDREGLSQTEGAAGVTGAAGLEQAGSGGARASAGAGSGNAPGKDLASSFSGSIREATPAYLANPSPEYPAIARRRGYEGTVLVEVLVSRDGRVEDLRLLQSSGYSVLDQAAMTSMKGWLFEPATINEEKVEMWVKVPVRFHLK
jgi:periplasmic protein TonB